MSESPDTTPAHEPVEAPFHQRVLVTGASGFVGRHIVRELLAKGHIPICLVRDRERLLAQMRGISTDRYSIVCGDLFTADALARAAEGSQAAIHLVGIIFERPLRGQTFRRIHVEGTHRVIEACKAAGIQRLAHMSALGTRRDAVSEYHRTKYEAELLVRESGLDWTILRPSIIHGPDGEFMQMMKTFVTKAMVPAFGFLPAPFPVIPYFGDGNAHLQPVSVKDVAEVFVSSLSLPETIGRIFELGGPEALTWKEFYRICKETIPGAKSWKPIVGQPVWAAKLLALTFMKLPILPPSMRFNAGQVQMSQEESTCSIEPVERTFGIRLRDFRTELAQYAAMIE